MRNFERKELLESLYRILDNWDDIGYVLGRLRVLRRRYLQDALERKASLYTGYSFRMYCLLRGRCNQRAIALYRRFASNKSRDIDADVFVRNISKIIYWLHCGQLSRAKHGTRIICRHCLQDTDHLLIRARRIALL